jgi:uncharacterized protein (TIGR03437 family)
MKRYRLLTLLAVAIPASAVTYDLSANWSNTTNPNGPWGYYQGTTALPLVSNWTAAATVWAASCNQPAWAPSNIAGSFIPAWIQINSCAATFFPVDPNNSPALDVVAGDVVIHTVDGANGNPSLGEGNVVFTLPASAGSGAYTITGSFWAARLAAVGVRPQDWQVTVNGKVIGNGVVTPAVTRSLPEVLNVTMTLNAGDKVQLQISRDPSNIYGDFVGAKLTIANSIPGISAVVTASSFGQSTSISPASIIEIYGSNLAPDSRSWAGSDFTGVNAPTSLDGTSVKIGGLAAFVSYISPGQVNVQVPSTVLTGAQPVIVTTAAGSSASFTSNVNITQGGLLAPPSFDLGGKQYVVALYSDGATYVLPPGTIAGINSRRALPGDTITFYGVGFGPVTPAIPAGQIVQQTNSLALPFHLFFGQTEAVLTYAGLAPAEVGLYQFNVVVPNIAASDLIPLSFTLNGVAGSQTLFISVQ